MFSFITAPLVVGLVVLGIYGLFELFVRRKERLAIIEKIGDKLDASAFAGKLSLPAYSTFKFSFSSFSSLKIGCLLMGIGLGLLIASFFSLSLSTAYSRVEGISSWDLINALYGACVLLCGGLGLILAFIIETRMAKKNK